MNLKEKIEVIKNYLKGNNKDCYVIYDYCCTNSVLISLLGKHFFTRKLFIIIDLKNKARIICHTIDRSAIDENLAKYFKILEYKRWQQLIDILKKELHGKDALADYSEYGLLPRCSYCDWGSMELLKSITKKLSSSCDLISQLCATLDNEQILSHKKAMEKISKIKDKAFKMIENYLKQGREIDEFMVAQFICKCYASEHLVSDSLPIVAVNDNASNPHYEPSKNKSSKIKAGDLILIDLWAKLDCENGVWADITWMAYAGKEVPQKYQEAFDVLVKGTFQALEYLNDNLGKCEICGYEIDDVVRNFLAKHGYSKYFTHRTGHSIAYGNSPHGEGVNIDNYEAHDTRKITNNIIFSLEPGIYMAKFGMRREINVLIKDDKAQVTSPMQEKIICLNVSI